MPISKELFAAVLSLDAYNRGYDPSMDVAGSAIGGAVPIQRVINVDDTTYGEWQDNGFYAVAYEIENGAAKDLKSSNIVISFRGTNDLIGHDGWNDFQAISGVDGFPEQFRLAAEFYQSVKNANPDKTIILTGHSLGGALAGFVASLYGEEALLYNNIQFEGFSEYVYNSAIVTDEEIMSFLDGVTGEAELALASAKILAAQGAREWALENFYKHGIKEGIDPSGIKAMSVPGDIAQFARSDQAVNPVGSQDENTNISVFPDHFPVPDSELEIFLAAINPFTNLVLQGILTANDLIRRAELHWQSLLVIKQYSSDNKYDEKWNYFYGEIVRSLYDDNISKSIGIMGDAGNGDYSTMQKMIAYSALEMGTKPFGDTAIRAMFNDIDRMSIYSDYLQDTVARQALADMVVQFSALLANRHIQFGAQTSGITIAQELKDKLGIIQVSDTGNLLTIDLSTKLWGIGANYTPPPILHQDIIWSISGAIDALARDDVNEALAHQPGFLARDIQYLHLAMGDGSVFDLAPSILGQPGDTAYGIFVSPLAHESQTINGTSGNDIIIAGDGEGERIINGGDGQNVLMGGAGNDVITGGTGDDVIFGGDGNDNLVGGGGKDFFSGGKGDDVINGGSSDEFLYGGAGSDQLYSGGGKDELYGDVGNDFLFGNSENQKLYGGNGEDWLYGGGGTDILDGGAGNDHFIFAAEGRGSATVKGGAGNDEVVLSGLRSEYTITYTDLGGANTRTAIVTRAGSSPLSVNVDGVETLKFDDKAVDLRKEPDVFGYMLSDDGQIYAIGYDLETKLVPGFSVDASWGNYQSNPAMSVDTDGTIHIAGGRLGFANEYSSIGATIHAQFDPVAGVFTSKNVSLDTHLFISQWESTATIAADGSLHVWYNNAKSTNSNLIWHIVAAYDDSDESEIALVKDYYNISGNLELENFVTGQVSRSDAIDTGPDGHVYSLRNIPSSDGYTEITRIGSFADERPVEQSYSFRLGDQDSSFFDISFTSDGVLIGINHKGEISKVDLDAGTVEKIGILSDLGLSSWTSADFDLVGSYAKLLEMLQPVDEKPNSILLSKASVAENVLTNTLIGIFSAADPEGKALTYKLLDTADGAFKLSGAKLLTAKPIDFEKLKSDTVMVEVSDGVNKVTKTFTITITDVDEEPVNVTLSKSTVAENAAIGTAIGSFTATDPEGKTLTYTLTDSAGGLFKLFGNKLVTAKALDYERLKSDTVAIEVSDGSNKVAKTFTIGITDINEAPGSITLSKTSVAENVAIGTTVGAFAASDPEGKALTYTLTDTAGGLFKLSGAKLLTAKAIDYEKLKSDTVTIEVSDGTHKITKTFTIGITDVNETPASVSLSKSTITENVAVGTVVGAFAATDPEGKTLTYKLTDSADGMFKLSGNKLVTAKTLDHEKLKSDTVAIEVSDGTSRVTKTFRIDITNVNEAPTSVTLSKTTVAENTAIGTTVGTFAATDPEGGALNYKLTDSAGGLFKLSGTKLLTAKAIDFEKLKSDTVTVEVSDGTHKVTKTFTIGITDVNEAPGDIVLSKSTVAENAKVGTVVGTFGASDPEGRNLSYKLTDSAGGLFKLSGTSLVTAKALDYEKLRSDTVTVEVSDGLSKVSKVFTVGVTDVRETLSGTAKADTLKGGIGADLLDGRDGSDSLYGNDGNDILLGGKGADDLYGGAGKDIFQFKTLSDSTVASSGRDTIFDFSVSAGDIIDLSGIDANTGKSGDQVFNFIAMGAFSGKAGELRYEKLASDTYIYGDVNGDRKSDLAIHLDDPLTLKDSSFIL